MTNAFDYGVKLAGPYVEGPVVASMLADVTGGALGALGVDQVVKRDEELKKNRVGRALTGFHAGVEGASALVQAYTANELRKNPDAFSRLARNIVLQQSNGNVSDRFLRSAQAAAHVGQLGLTGLAGGLSLYSGAKALSRFHSAVDPEFHPVNPTDEKDVEDLRYSNAGILHKSFNVGPSPKYNDPNFRQRHVEDPETVKKIKPLAFGLAAGAALGYPLYKMRKPILNTVGKAFSDYVKNRTAAKDALRNAASVQMRDLVADTGHRVAQSGKLIF